jgi:GAF domain-containing protein
MRDEVIVARGAQPMGFQMVDPHALQELAELFSDLGKDLLSARGLDSTLGLLTRRSVEIVADAEYAAVSRGRNGRFETIGATGDVPAQVDRIQYELGTGPCVDAAIEEAIFRTGNLLTDPRWPDFGKRAADETGIVSMLSVRPFLEDDDLVAALNMYSKQLGAFTASDETVGMMLATHASLAMTSARLHDDVAHLQRALRSNRGIGVAMGVLMSQYKVTEVQAFDLLRMASQHSHRKLVDIASDVTETGILDLPRLIDRQTGV